MFLDYKKVFNVLRGCGLFFTIWPRNVDSGRFWDFWYAIIWWVNVLNSGATIPSSALAAYYYRGDLVNMMKSLVELTYLFEACFNFIYCTVKVSNWEFLLSPIARLAKQPTFQEEKILIKYLKRTEAFYTVMPVVFVIGALIFAISPLVMPRIVPLNTIYLLPMDKTWALYVVYTLNIFSIIEASVAIVIDMIVITVFWHATLKFELINNQLEIVSNNEQLRRCVLKHQEAINYVKKTEDTVAPIIVKSTIAVSIYMITCSLLALNNVPIYEMTQFFLVTFLSSVRLFVCSWSAEVMTDMARDIGWSLYSASWPEGSPKLRRNVILVLQRCQKPVGISATGFINILSLGFCGAVLYKTFSYFMTLRAIIGE